MPAPHNAKNVVDVVTHVEEIGQPCRQVSLTSLALLDSLDNKVSRGLDVMIKHHAGGPLRDAEVAQLIRRHSTAVVLLHHAVAEHMGLGPTDLKCFDLLREHGAASASELAAITGLTSGALTGVVARLESAGFIHREPDPNDGRRQILSPLHEHAPEIHRVFEPLLADISALLATFDNRQREVIHVFLQQTTDAIYRQVALLRGRGLQPDRHKPGRHA